jgi:hypothetical protein
MDIRVREDPDRFEFSELIEMGRRLTEGQLQHMNLFDSVRQAEREAYWRFKAAAEALSKIGNDLSDDVQQKAQEAEQQFFDPSRGNSSYTGGTSRAYGRTLPSPGALLVKGHRFQRHSLRRKRQKADQSRVRAHQQFRFAVVEQPSSLILLGSDDGPVYRNPSRAAKAATGTSADGWKFFGIN